MMRCANRRHRLVARLYHRAGRHRGRGVAGATGVALTTGGLRRDAETPDERLGLREAYTAARSSLSAQRITIFNRSFGQPGHPPVDVDQCQYFGS